MNKKIHTRNRYFYGFVFIIISIFGWGQTNVVIGGGAAVTCPATPTATWTTPPTGITFSNWSRGTGVSCASAGNALSGSGFNVATSALAFTGNKYYTVTISADATHTFTLNSISWATQLSGTTNSASFIIKYSNNGGALTDFATSQSITSSGAATTLNFNSGSTINISAGTSIVLYLIPFNATAAGTTVRWANGSIINITASTVPSVFISRQTGDWNDPLTWNPSGTALPTDSDNVTISAGHTVYTSTALTRDATTTVNGKFQINAGGWAGGTTDFTYAAGSELIFNHSNSTVYGPVDNSHKYWPATNAPPNITLNANSPVNLGVARTVSGTFATSSALIGANNLTVSGINQINSTGGTFDTAVNYGAAATLVYNVNAIIGRGNEWNNNPAHVTLQNNSVLDYPNGWGAIVRTITGNLTIGSGSALYMDFNNPATGVGLLTVGGNVINNGSLSLGNQSGGDIKVAGNWTDAGIFNPKNRTVFFNGTSTQTVTNSSVFVDGHYLEIFDFLTVEGSGTLKLGFDTNIRVLANNGLSLSSTNATSTIDLSGNTLNYNGGGNINLNGGNRFITSTGVTGYFRIADVNASVINPGTLTLDANSTLLINNAGFDAGAGNATTVNGSLLIKPGGFITGNTVRYGVGSSLKYSIGGLYNRGMEWNASSLVSPIGLPYNVQLMDATTLNYVNLANLGNQYIVNNLIIDLGTKLYMDYGSVSCNGSLNVGNNLTSAGDLTLGYAFGDDLKIGGNINFNAGYTFDAKGRAIYFTKTTGNQVITASSKPTFHYVNITGTNNLVRLAAGTSLDITAPNGGNVVSFTNAANIFDINDGNTLTLGTSGVGNTIFGSGLFTTGSNATPGNMVLLGNGSIGTLNFGGNQNLANFTINRQAGTIAAVLGTDIRVSTSFNLTNGIVDLGANLMTIGSASAGSGAIVGGNANSYVIADKTIGGSLRRYTPIVNSYFFPIGDATSSADGTQYSPATINLTTATLISNSYLTLNVDDIKEPNNQADTDYITRYWNLNGLSVTTATYDITATYLNADIVGTETNYKSGRYANSVWTVKDFTAANTLNLTSLTTASGAINNTADTNHFTSGHPFTKAEINVKQGATSYATGSTYAFGNVEININKDITFTIENLGLENLNLGAATITGSGFTLNTTYSTPVNGMSTTTFIIRFTPNALGAFTGSISIPNNDISGAENPYVINFTGTGVVSSLTDIIPVASSEQATISSLINTTIISSVSDGAQVWQFTIREGGATGDADNLPSILTSLNIAKSSFSAISDWRDAIYSIGLFDGSTLIANGNVNSASQIQFTGINVNIADNTSKTLSLRLSLKCPLGVGAVDGDDFVFSIANTNVTFDTAIGSGNASFTAAASNDAKNIIDVVATKLIFIQDATTTMLNDAMTSVILNATDACNNKDKDYTSAITITSTGTLSGAVTGTFVAGSVTFNSIVHSAVATGRQLTATSGVLTQISAIFDIVVATVLYPGDLAILAANTSIDVSGNDELVFVAFKDITPGTKIFITDNGYETRYANKWGNTEGVISITRIGSTLPKGTIITLETTNGNVTSGSHYNLYTCGTIDNNWTKSIETGGSGFNMNEDDDVWIMQGGVWNNGTSGNIAGLPSQDATYTGNVLYGWTESGWNIGVGDGAAGHADPTIDRTRYSTIYPNLKCFTTVAPTGPGKVKFNLQNFTSIITNDQLEWIALINNTLNWTTFIDNSAYNIGGYNYLGNTICAPITIFNDTHTNGKWNGTNNVNWFDCSNWDTLKVPDATTNVTFNSTVSNNAVIDATATDSDLYSDIARALNITIDKSLTIEANTNNKLEVYGDLTLNAGGTLDMDDNNIATQDGQIYLYGNWNNNAGDANFLQGQGTVNLVGASTQIINGNNHSNVEKFGNLVLGNNYDTAVSNDLFMDGNFTVNATKNLTINTGGNYVEVGGNMINNGNVSVENDGNLIQRGPIYTGNSISVKRNANLKKSDYNYWGSPVNGQVLKTFSPNTAWNRYMTYNEVDDYFYMEPSANTFTPGKGYAIQADKTYSSTLQTFIGQYNGVPNNGDISFNLGCTSCTVSNNGYNLVSNPYPSNIDFDILQSDAANTGLIYNTYYLWTNINFNPQMQGSNYPGTGIINNYAVYNGSGGLGAPYGFTGAGVNSPVSATPNQFLKVGQGFIIKAKSVGTLNFKNATRTKDNTATFFNKNNNSISKDRFWLTIKTPLDYVTPLLIAYVQGATNNFELDYDAPLLVEASDSFYSILGNEKLAIQGKQYPLQNTDVVPLGVNYNADGEYTISIFNKEGVFVNEQAIFLKDKLNNKIVNLQETSYTFNATKGQDLSRFEIIYQAENILTVDNITKNNVLVYKENDHFIISSKGKLIKEVRVLDASGRLLQNIKANKKEILIQNSKLNKGVNVFSIIFDDEIINKKIVF